MLIRLLSLYCILQNATLNAQHASFNTLIESGWYPEHAIHAVKELNPDQLDRAAELKKHKCNGWTSVWVAKKFDPDQIDRTIELVDAGWSLHNAAEAVETLDPDQLDRAVALEKHEGWNGWSSIFAIKRLRPDQIGRVIELVDRGWVNETAIHGLRVLSPDQIEQVEQMQADGMHMIDAIIAIRDRTQPPLQAQSMQLVADAVDIADSVYTVDVASAEIDVEFKGMARHYPMCPQLKTKRRECNGCAHARAQHALHAQRMQLLINSASADAGAKFQGMASHYPMCPQLKTKRRECNGCAQAREQRALKRR